VTTVICGLRGTFIFYKMLDEVNARLPESERFSPAWWYAGKTLRLRHEYRRLYPSAPRLTQLRSVGFVEVAIAVTAALALGFGVAGAAFAEERT
jgi:hypothetical protein